MARRTKAEKQLDDAIELAFSKYGSNVQFDIMDLSKITAETKAAVQSGSSVDEAMQAAVAKYRKN